MDIAKRLRYFQQKTGTQGKEIAISLGVRESFISGILTGKKKCSVENLEKICAVMGISMQQFYAKEDDIKPLTSEEQKLLNDFRALDSEEAKRRVLGFAEFEHNQQELPDDTRDGSSGLTDSDKNGKKIRYKKAK